MNKLILAKIDWCRWMLIYCGLTYFALWFEASINHFSAYKEHAMMLTPIIFGPIAAIITISAFFSRGIRNFIWIIGLLSVIVGVMGTLLHSIPIITEEYHGNIIKTLTTTEFPPLAPGAFAGNGVLVLISWFAEKFKGESN